MLKNTVKTTVTKERSGFVDTEELKEKLGLSKHAKLFVTVPSGGDYSDTELDIDTDIQLQFYDVIVETSEDENK